MNISQLLEALKDPTVALTLSEKLLAGVCVALLSMGVVFIVLVLISGIISVLQREKKESKVVQKLDSKVDEESKSLEVKNESEDMGELVSVITAAICAATGNSSNNIIVRKIVRSNNSKSNWEGMSKKR